MEPEQKPTNSEQDTQTNTTVNDPATVTPAEGTPSEQVSVDIPSVTPEPTTESNPELSMQTQMPPAATQEDPAPVAATPGPVEQSADLIPQTPDPSESPAGDPPVQPAPIDGGPAPTLRPKPPKKSSAMVAIVVGAVVIILLAAIAAYAYSKANH